MTRNNLNYFFLFFIFITILLLSTKVFSDENIKFQSLKKNEVNLRQGPSFEYPVILAYKKKYLPVIVLDKFDTWKKIKDFENNSGWIHSSQLSRKKSAINIKNYSILFDKPTIFSNPIAKLETGKLVLIKKCKLEWCRVSAENFNGWILKNYLWGETK